MSSGEKENQPIENVKHPIHLNELGLEDEAEPEEDPYNTLNEFGLEDEEEAPDEDRYNTLNEFGLEDEADADPYNPLNRSDEFGLEDEDEFDESGLEEDAVEDPFDYPESDGSDQYEYPDSMDRDMPDNGQFDDGGDFTQYYSIKKISRHRSTKLRTAVDEYKLQFHNLENFSPIEFIDQFEGIFSEMIMSVAAKLRGYDYFRVVFENSSLNNPIAFSYMRADNYSIEYMLDEIVRVLQSYVDFRLDASTFLHVTSTFIPDEGSGTPGFQNRNIGHLPVWIRGKQNGTLIKPPKTADGYCGFASCAIGMNLWEQPAGNKELRKQKKWIKSKAQEIADKTGLQLGALSIDGVKTIQSFFPEYKFSVYDFGIKSMELIFEGESNSMKFVNLLLTAGHYYCIKSLAGMTKARHYCEKCNATTTTANHMCSKTKRCFLCKQKNCLNSESYGSAQYKCDQCNIIFSTVECKIAHEGDFCQQFAWCENCDKVIKRKLLSPGDLHKCKLTWCRVCAKYRESYTDHVHYVPVLSTSDDPDPLALTTATAPPANNNRKIGRRKNVDQSFWVLDFETSTDATSHHISALLGVLQHESGEPCYVFHGSNTVDQFLDTLLQFDLSKTTYTICAHFGGRFDYYCFLRRLTDRKLAPNIIKRGTRIILMSLLNGRIRFIDSYNFIPIPLRNLPRAFSVTEAAKGWFPYSLITVENLKKTIAFPPYEAFEPDTMMLSEKKQFDEWYTEMNAKNEPYDILKNLVSYCKSDCDVLRLSLLKYRSAYVQQFGLDPCIRASTMTACNFLVLRKKFLKEDSLAVISDLGFLRTEFSQIACVWLQFISQTENIQIQSAQNGHEKRFSAYRVDGYSPAGDAPKILYKVENPNRPTCYFFFGCLWHGDLRPDCPIVKDMDTKEIFMGRSLGARNAATQKCLRYFRQRVDVNIVYIYECEFKALLHKSAEAKAVQNSFGGKNPFLQVRMGYQGGRVEPFCLFHKCAPDEKIYYLDYNSQYPYIMFKLPFFIGKPTVHRCDFKSPETYNGLIFAKMLPSRSNFIPLLPCRIGQALAFTNCRRCFENRFRGDCICCDEDRAITGVWTTAEVNQALIDGYKCMQIYEVWHYSGEAISNDIFKEFVRLNIQKKAESSGFDTSIEHDPIKQQAYLDAYDREFGIKLNREDIRIEPSMRTLSKLCVNSISGRLGLKNAKQRVVYVKNFNELKQLIYNKNYEINDINILNEDMALVIFTEKQTVEDDTLINIVTISQITSQGRLMIYDALKKIHESGSKILYCDTDSVIFVKKDCVKVDLEESLILGGLKNEITSDYGEDYYISEFYATAPKSYGYLIKGPNNFEKGVLKIKGFRLDVKTSLLLNADLMKKLILSAIDEDNSEKVTYKRRIHRNFITGALFEKPESKIFRKSMHDKRIPQNDMVTVPYGYRKSIQEQILDCCDCAQQQHSQACSTHRRFFNIYHPDHGKYFSV